MPVVMRALHADFTSDNEHDDEDDWETPEGDGNRIESKVLHIVQLLHAPYSCLLQPGPLMPATGVVSDQLKLVVRSSKQQKNMEHKPESENVL